MSDLHTLSAPIEESPEEITAKETKKKHFEKAQLKAALKKSTIVMWEDFKRKYLKKLLLSLGIAFVVGIVIIWVLGKLLTKSAVPEITPEVVNTPPAKQENTVKYLKFDGHQYYFYVPESYSFLNRTRNDDLNEVVFTNDKKATAFTLQEFEAENDNEETLDSIYSYIATTLSPNENKTIKIGDNTFKRRIYRQCEATDQTSPQTANPCVAGNTYYSIYINGTVVIFGVSNASDNNLEGSFLNTFVKNIITPQSLSDEYLSAKLPIIKNKLQALFILGVPVKVEDKNGVSEISWQGAAPNLKIIIGFDANKMPVSRFGSLDDKFTFNLDNKITPAIAKTVYDYLLVKGGIQSILEATPDAIFFMDDHLVDDNSWEVAISSPEEDGSILIDQYKVDKTSYRIEEFTSAN